MTVRTFARVAFRLQRFEVLTAIAATAALVVTAVVARSLLDAEACSTGSSVPATSVSLPVAQVVMMTTIAMN